jgi:o-succinylbenzoate synthase
MLKASYQKYELAFKQPVLTSRGEMKTKNGYFLFLENEKHKGVGECSYIEGLSIDNLKGYEGALSAACTAFESASESPVDLSQFPSIAFGIETAQTDLAGGGSKVLFQSAFTGGKQQIPINGLVWMGKKDKMLQQVKQKLTDGFKCIKIKVGAINFDEEVELLSYVRDHFPPDVIEIRLDANGAFSFDEVFEKLDTLSQFHIHSIEQPIKQGQAEFMRNVCHNSPIPVALDEELIGVYGTVQDDILDLIKPQYIILKPSLLGGFKASDEWIKKAEARNIKWWATSALESNIGLNAIAQWVFTKNATMVQGLGTGSLYSNNITSPLFIYNGHLGYDPTVPWQENF